MTFMYITIYFFFNKQGQPSGDAFVQMSSEEAAYQCSQQRHHHNMVFGERIGSIEVFQCSGNDMNQILTGGAIQR